MRRLLLPQRLPGVLRRFLPAVLRFVGLLSVVSLELQLRRQLPLAPIVFEGFFTFVPFLLRPLLLCQGRVVAGGMLAGELVLAAAQLQPILHAIL